MTKKKKTKQVTRTKPTEETVEPFVDGCLSIIGEGDDPRMDKAILARKAGMSVYRAGLFAGYSKDYSKSKLSGMLQDGAKFKKRIEEMARKLPAFFRDVNNLHLIDLAQAQESAMEMYKQNPELLIKHPQLARQVKQMAGILDDEVKPQPTINIKTMNVMQNMIGADLQATVDAGKKDVIDAEILPENKRITHKIKVK